MAVQYQGRIDHTEDSIQALFQAQYNTYRLGLVVVTAVAGVALAAAGLFAPVPMLAQGLLILAGCLLFTGRDFPAIVRAESVIEARGGALPSAVCTFCAGHMELEEGGVKKKLRYDQLDRIVQDRRYLYLFFGPDSAVMVERSKIGPGTADEVMQRTSSGSGTTARRARPAAKAGPKPAERPAESGPNDLVRSALRAASGMMSRRGTFRIITTLGERRKEENRNGDSEGGRLTRGGPQAKRRFSIPMKKLISRRHFLAALGAAAAAGALSGCGGQAAQTNANGEHVFELTLSHGLAEDHAVHIALSSFADAVREQSEGTIDIQIFPNATLGSEVDNITARWTTSPRSAPARWIWPRSRLPPWATSSRSGTFCRCPTSSTTSSTTTTSWTARSPRTCTS